MAKGRGSKKSSQSLSQQQSLKSLCAALGRLVERQAYSQALKKLEQIQKAYPGAELPATVPSLGELWYRLGQDYWSKHQIKLAERAWVEAIAHRYFAAYYDLAKFYLNQDRLSEAQTLLQGAFADGTLPQELGGCYGKILFLAGDLDSLKTLVQESPERLEVHQRHWIQGILALHAGEHGEAAACFAQVTKPVSPSDDPDLWLAYVADKQNNHDEVRSRLGLSAKGDRSGAASPNSALDQFTIDYVRRNSLDLPPHLASHRGSLKTDPGKFKLRLALDHAESQDYLAAARNLYVLSRKSLPVSEDFAALEASLLQLGAEAAWQEDDCEEAELLWERYLQVYGFDPQVAVKLAETQKFLDHWGHFRQTLATIRQWLSLEAKTNPQHWIPQRYQEVLGETWYREFDSYLKSGTIEQRAAIRALETLEELLPGHPLALAARGFYHLTHGLEAEGLALVEQSLEQIQGHDRYYWIYYTLRSYFTTKKQQDKLLDLQQRFGKTYDDVPPVETSLTLPPWQQAFLHPTLLGFCETVREAIADLKPQQAQLNASADTVALYGCQCFGDALGDDLENEIKPKDAKATFELPVLAKTCDAFLKKTAPEFRGVALQVICLGLYRFVKRKKGLADLTKVYWQQLEQLAQTQPPLQVPYWVVRVMRTSKLSQLQKDLLAYLSRQPDPSLALAQLQLEVRLFGVTDLLRPLLEIAFKRDSHTPQLPLALATTFDSSSDDYVAYQTESFELARRIQDQAALAACRQEDAIADRVAHHHRMLRWNSSRRGRYGPLFLRGLLENDLDLDRLNDLMPRLLNLFESDFPDDF